MRVALAGLALLTVAGCGSGLEVATRGGTSGEATQAFLVQVLDAPPQRPATMVSLARDVRSRYDALPASPDAATLEKMREQVAAAGGNALLVERVDTPWKKAFYGAGYRWLDEGGDAPIPECAQPEAQAASKAAVAEAARCLKGLKAKRPALSGEVEVLLTVDAFGDVWRAAPTPASSRDTLVQRCVMDAVFGQSWGKPKDALACRASVRAGF